MTILDLMCDTGITPTGAEGRRLINHGCVFLLPDWWAVDDPIPEHVLLITDPNYELCPGDIVNVHKYVYKYFGADNYTMVQDRSKK